MVISRFDLKKTFRISLVPTAQSPSDFLFVLIITSYPFLYNCNSGLQGQFLMTHKQPHRCGEQHLWLIFHTNLTYTIKLSSYSVGHKIKRGNCITASDHTEINPPPPPSGQKASKQYDKEGTKNGDNEGN